MTAPETAAARPLPPRILVLGVGNLLVGDEGLGVHAIRALARESWPSHVDLLDGGTGGFHLLASLQDYPRIILIDATRDGAPAGTVGELRPRAFSDFPPALGAHDIGLRDLLSAMTLLGPLPDLTVITVSIEELKPMTLELSPPVAAALPEVAARVRAQVGAGNAAKPGRPPPGS